ncbi:aspartate/glutamate racemase family protein [Nodosilinea sp. P-1105]|uniref:aspartate/glutamate racemase family protein n=1 Tax=Nodosilinea sp. P-1105 TaxID=2546229 RepID=UPI00146D429B|nr:aspartate/glutamate racemase family protein [Nodosilinea sp. P-1105]NMF81781.1 aspartate/glutamate racemase family protein [Nodosilinea sp. P-1105]
MKTIGLIGGMSWQSSLEYYRMINQLTSDRLGGLHSAKIILFSVDFADIAIVQHNDRWSEAAAILIEAAQQLQMAGASLVLLCTNTMHKVADAIEGRISVPFLHIADVTAAAIKAQGLSRVGLLGTKFTMEQDFYRRRLTEKHGLEVLVPQPRDRDTLHQIIYDELCLGAIAPNSRQQVHTICTTLAQAGAEGIILGCTELELLIQQAPVPLFPTTQLHAEAAVKGALAE